MTRGRTEHDKTARWRQRTPRISYGEHCESHRENHDKIDRASIRARFPWFRSHLVEVLLDSCLGAALRLEDGEVSKTVGDELRTAKKDRLSDVQGTTSILEKDAPRMQGQMKILHVGSHHFVESLWELRWELCGMCWSRRFAERIWGECFILVRRTVGKLPANFSANSDSEFFGSLFFQGFRPPKKLTPKIHVQNCRHSSPISLSWTQNLFTAIFCLRGRPPCVPLCCKNLCCASHLVGELQAVDPSSCPGGP